MPRSKRSFSGPPSNAPISDAPYSKHRKLQHERQRRVSVVHWPGTVINMEDRLVAVIVTIVGGKSYDRLFRKVPQLAGEGQRVAVYEVLSDGVNDLIWALENEPDGARSGRDPLTLLAKDIYSVAPDCVVFNWECCSGCRSDGFRNTKSLHLIERVIARGSMVMVSDYSLEALISSWQVDLLGPNPFVKIGEFGESFTLHFEPEVLKNCDSAQLQRLGELCLEGKATLNAMQDTIMYTVDQRTALTPAYQLKVLTVASPRSGVDLARLPTTQICSIGDQHGAAGHVMLSYPTGGRLLASCGHWVELSKLDVSVESLFAAAEKNYGARYTSEMRCRMRKMACNGEMQSFLQRESCQMIQQSTPQCTSSRISGYM